MRGGLSLVLLAGCAAEPPELQGVVPAEISARGGQEICLVGERLPKRGQVLIAGAVAGEATRDIDGRLCLEAPALLAGVYDVQLGEGEGAPTLEAGLSVRPLELAFVEAAAHYLPTPGAPLRGGLAFDADADGREDIVAWDAAGDLVVWRSEGTGAFTALPGPSLGGQVGGLARMRTPEGPALFACMADGVRARLLMGDAPGLLTVADAPAEVGRCAAAAAADLDGDGWDEALAFRAGGVRIWTPRDAGLARFGSQARVDAESCGALSASGEAEPDCLVLDGAATFWAMGTGEARLTVSLPPVAAEGAWLELDVGGDLATLEVVDATGGRFRHVPGAVEEDPSRLLTPPVAEWEGDGEAPPVPPLATASLVLAPAGDTVSLTLTGLTVGLPGGAAAPAVRYGVFPMDLDTAAHGAVAIAPTERAPGQLLLLADPAPALFTGGAAGWSAAAPGALPDTGCSASAATTLDADADGEPELYLACALQDRLLRGDGTGRWFDDTLGSLPVDAGDGRGVAAADLDHDGLPELLIATEAGVDRLYRGDGARFEDWSTRLGLRDGSGRSVVALDVDEDGDLDVMVLNGAGEAARLLIHDGQ